MDIFGLPANRGLFRVTRYRPSNHHPHTDLIAPIMRQPSAHQCDLVKYSWSHAISYGWSRILISSRDENGFKFLHQSCYYFLKFKLLDALKRYMQIDTLPCDNQITKFKVAWFYSLNYVYKSIIITPYMRLIILDFSKCPFVYIKC